MPSSLRVIKANRSYHHEEKAKINTEIRFEEVVESFADEEVSEIQSQYAARMEQLLKEAETQKEQELLAAREEAAAIREQAQQDGYSAGQQAGMEAGYQTGYEQGVVQAEQLKQQANQMVQESIDVVAAYYAEKKVEVIELAAQMAEKIIHEKIDTTEETLLNLIDPILSRMEQANTFITITVTPDKVAWMKARAKELEKEFPLFRFAIFSDATLEKNGCVIESPHTISDLQIHQQLEAMVQELRELQVADHV